MVCSCSGYGMGDTATTIRQYKQAETKRCCTQTSLGFLLLNGHRGQVCLMVMLAGVFQEVNCSIEPMKSRARRSQMWIPLSTWNNTWGSSTEYLSTWRGSWCTWYLHSLYCAMEESLMKLQYIVYESNAIPLTGGSLELFWSCCAFSRHIP